MIKSIKTKWFNMTFVLRHRWEKNSDMDNYTVWKLRKEYELGIWVKPYLAVGKPNGQWVGKKIFNKDNHVRGYMIGLDLIVCKMWVDISGARVLEIPVDKKFNNQC
jgi:hypothetical protein